MALPNARWVVACQWIGSSGDETANSFASMKSIPRAWQARPRTPASILDFSHPPRHSSCLTQPLSSALSPSAGGQITWIVGTIAAFQPSRPAPLDCTISTSCITPAVISSALRSKRAFMSFVPSMMITWSSGWCDISIARSGAVPSKCGPSTGSAPCVTRPGRHSSITSASSWLTICRGQRPAYRWPLPSSR